jgi:hypothetical protein
MTTGHPNTIAASLAGALGTLTAYLLKKYAALDITTVQTGAIATGYAAVILFIGRRGVKGAVLAVWNGVWNGAPKPEAPPAA